MPAPLLPAATITRGQDARFKITMSGGNDVSTWDIALTIREDPSYPRKLPDERLRELDVDVSDWGLIYTSSTVVDLGVATGVFAFDVPRATTQDMIAGSRRYVVDVWRTESGATYPLVQPTWLDVRGSVYDVDA